MLTLDGALENYANINKACKEYDRLYAKEYYHKNKERNKEARRGYYRQWRENETPEEREAYLARRREQYKARKGKKKK
jgi:hypothetical protein